MANFKKRKAAVKKTKKVRKDPRIEEIYEEEITFVCPIRGLVTQKVKVKKYRSYDFNGKRLVSPDNPIHDLEEKEGILPESPDEEESSG